jgi:trigger factor
MLAEIVKAEEIAITDEEIEAEYEAMAKQYELEVEKIKKSVSAEELKTNLETRKAVKVIVDSAVAVAPKAPKAKTTKAPKAKKSTEE